jgi:hypothetical protein
MESVLDNRLNSIYSRCMTREEFIKTIDEIFQKAIDRIYQIVEEVKKEPVK